MYVTFENTSALDPDLRQLVVHRAHHAMRGFSLAITQAHVHLSKSLDMSVSSEKRCWVQLTVGDSAIAIAIGVAQAAEWAPAIDRALARALRTVPQIQRRFRHSARAAMQASWARRAGGPSPTFTQ